MNGTVDNLPSGKQISLHNVTLDPQPKTYEMIGVVEEVHYYKIREPQRSGVYLPAFHDGFISANTFVVATTVDPGDVAGDVRAGIRKALPDLSIFRTVTLKAQIDGSVISERHILENARLSDLSLRGCTDDASDRVPPGEALRA